MNETPQESSGYGYLEGDWTGLFPSGSIITMDHGNGNTEQARIGIYIPGRGTSFSPVSEEGYFHEMIERWAQKYLDDADKDDLDISC